MNKQIGVGVSARHVHVSRKDLDVLYGEGHELQVHKELSAPGQFAAKETVDLVTEKGTFKNVRILGPGRKQTQVELSLSDAIKLGLKEIPVRDSGNLAGTPGITMVGPNGTLKLTEGVIVAARHIHMPESVAKELGLKEKQLVKVRTGTEDRALVFEKVLIRLHKDDMLEMHLDTDEGNAAHVKTGDKAEIVD